VKAAAFIGDDRIVDLDLAAELVRGGEDLRGLIPDVPPNKAFSFFDLRLGTFHFDFAPRREWASRHLFAADQFEWAAERLVKHAGMHAATENLFATAELATMALMELSKTPNTNHTSRSAWLLAHGPRLGLTPDEAATLSVLLGARNVYRYGDKQTTATPVTVVEQLPHVRRLMEVARHALERQDSTQ
jgi:hypothetical protein